MKYALLLPVSLFLLFCGCTKTPYLVLFNNSGRSITINSEGTIYVVASGAAKEVQYPGNTELLTINSTPKTKREYKVRYPDKAYMNGNKFYVQIESDGSIYVIPPRSQVPVKQFVAQPDGFPWRPKVLTGVWKTTPSNG
jgi:hypothetical protein